MRSLPIIPHIKDPVAYEELYTNYLAVKSAIVLSAGGVSDSSASSSDDATADGPVSPTQEPTFELLYNQACLRLGHMDYTGALELLERSEQRCRSTLQADGYSAEEIEEEVASILLQKGFVMQNLGRMEEAKQLYRATLASK